MTPGLDESFGATASSTRRSPSWRSPAGAFGAAVTGLRPIFEIMFADFLPLAMDSLINQSAKYWYVSNEQASVPLVVRSAMGAGGNFGAMHSQSPIPWLQGMPGLKVVAPATAGDAKALLKAAIRDDNPVVFLEHKRLYSVKDPLPEEETLPLGKAAVRARGRRRDPRLDLQGRARLPARGRGAGERGVEAEVVDLRSLRPLDVETVLESVARTNRIVAVEEGPLIGGWGGEPARHRRRRGTARARRRLGDRLPGDADPLQPLARGRVHPGGGPDRRRGRGPARRRRRADDRGVRRRWRRRRCTR